MARYYSSSLTGTYSLRAHHSTEIYACAFGQILCIFFVTGERALCRHFSALVKSTHAHSGKLFEYQPHPLCKLKTMDLLRDNPLLRPFVLSNVTLTGTRIGAGAYGSVDEVAISLLKRSTTSSKTVPRSHRMKFVGRRPSL